MNYQVHCEIIKIAVLIGFIIHCRKDVVGTCNYNFSQLPKEYCLYNQRHLMDSFEFDESLTNIVPEIFIF